MATKHEIPSQASNLEHEVASGRTAVVIAAEKTFLNSLAISNPQTEMRIQAKNVITPIDIELDSIIGHQETKVAVETIDAAPDQNAEAPKAAVEGEQIDQMMHELEVRKRREIAEMFSGVQALEHEE